MKYLLALMFIAFSLMSVQAQADYPKVFIAPMDQNFNNFIAASIIREKVPIVITVTDETAEYVITGTAVKGSNKWYDTVFGSEKDRNQGSIQMIRQSDKTVVWAGSAGDKSFWFNEFKKGGQQKVADRLAKRMKKEFFNNRKKV